MLQSVRAEELRKQQDQLKAEHAALKERLKWFEQQRFLTSSEDQERKSLQKQKLAAKDQLVLIGKALQAEH